MSTFNSADIPVLQVQLDTVQQEISYNGTIKVIPDNYWQDELVPFLYPLWDSDKDKLIMFSWFTNNTYYAKRRRFIKNFKTGEYEWIDYEMEQVDVEQAKQVRDKLVETFYLIDSIENEEFQTELSRMYGKQRQVSPFTVRLARNFLLSETDWALAVDSPLDADAKAQYTLYRSKLRDLTTADEFSTNPEGVKFPISPDFFKKVYSEDYPDREYLATDDQWLPISKHYLKLFREKIANFLVLKSLTESNYFSTLLLEYEKLKNANAVEDVDVGEQNLTEEQLADRKKWLEMLITKVEEELDTENDE
jgi:hypothetical protein